jgi:hypothetical protein
LVISIDATSERRKIMSKKIAILLKVCIVVGFVAVLSNPAQANWTETFGGNAFDQTWVWGCYPDVTKTFTHTIKDGPDNDDYLSIDETTKFDTGTGSYGSAFGIGFVQAQTFTDVRVATVVNIVGDASSFYQGMGARASYFIDNGSITGVPGIVANAYIMHINWQNWPPYLSIDIEKVVWDQNTMRQGFDVRVPGLNNAHSFYAALDVIGSNPVYVTGYLYEYEGGPLVAKTGTLIDTDAVDSWEDPPNPQIPGDEEKVFKNGLSGVFAQNERAVPVGYHTTFDTVSSVSDGPVAVCLGPADGATGVGVDTDLQWVAAAFATSQEVWFGKKGAMKKVAPAGNTYDPGPLQFGQTYQWQVNQVGAGGTVEGLVWTFTTEGTAEGCLLVDDFESYTDDWTLRDAWPDNIPLVDYAYLETATVYSGDQALRFEYQNQYSPYLTELTHTYADPQDWTRAGLAALYLYLRGDEDNYKQKLYVVLEDAEVPAKSHAVPAVPEPGGYAVKNESWQKWVIELSEFSDNGVNLARIKKVIIRVGDGTSSGQPENDTDMIYIDEIKVCPRMCSLNIGGDVDGNCRIDFGDFAAVADGWLAEGTYELP